MVHQQGDAFAQRGLGGADAFVRIGILKLVEAVKGNSGGLHVELCYVGRAARTRWRRLSISRPCLGWALGASSVQDWVQGKPA
ncbi:hypothetical protein GCM10028811_30270 [Uliginosibacterium sediminicola]